MWKKSSQKYFCEKKNFRQKMFYHKNFQKNNFGNFFIFEKKFGCNLVNFEKIEKILKVIVAIFLFKKKVG